MAAPSVFPLIDAGPTGGSQARELIQHLYVHVPFCTHICPYCAFHKEKNLLPAINAFLPALQRELGQARAQFHLQPTTLFFGGGTPSALSLTQLDQLFDNWPWSAVDEFTFEANPMSYTPEKARRLHQWGVNRISLGVQSFDDSLLQILGRTHRRRDLPHSMGILRDAGFSNINIDLMFSLPGQTLAQWDDSLRQALALQPEHISAYNLTYEEDTDFLARHRRGEFRADESTDRIFFSHAIDVLESAGYMQYEISNFARPGFASRHNLAIWQGKDYLGLGPSAVSTVGHRRWKNIADTLGYAASLMAGGCSIREEETLDPATRRTEMILLSLRTQWGVDLVWLGHRTEEVQHLVDGGLVRLESNRLILTREGRLVADSVTEILV